MALTRVLKRKLLALRQIPSLLYGCLTKMLPQVGRSSITATKRFNAPCPNQCKASISVSNDSHETFRRSANFQPSIWHYDDIQALNSKYKEESYAERQRVLTEEVRMMLCKLANPLDQLELIDTLQRLGVAYQFNSEIKKMLENIYNNVDKFKSKKNLYATALEFRLLRQHGYNISTETFVSFQDYRGNFMNCLSTDIEGMLSLYEASFHSMENETILEKARDFTSKFLKEYVNKNPGSHIPLLVSHALDFPLQWRMPRWEALWFINEYERMPYMSPALLQLSKLDFNIVQTIHQEELKYTSRWWKRLGIAGKLSFTRDRMVEGFFCAQGLNFEPNLGYFRIVTTKVISLIAIIDDIYDAYGTLEEVELFTEAIDRWDVNGMDSLPYYMKICFLALYNFVNELALDILKEKELHILSYLKKAWKDLCKADLREAKWYYSGYRPSLQEYMENAWISVGAHVVFVHAYFLIPDPIRQEDLNFLKEYHTLFRFSASIFRLANDLGSSKREMEIGDVPNSIQCFMNESKASEADAREHVKSIICTTWKKMNGEVGNSPFSQRFTNIVGNLARATLWCYQHGDGYSDQNPETNNDITSLLFEPIPM